MAILSKSSICDMDREGRKEKNIVVVEDPIALLAAPKSLATSSEGLTSSSSVCSLSSSSSSCSSSSGSNGSKVTTKSNDLISSSNALLSSDENDPWSVYDRIVCLNLRERIDRYEHMKDELSRIGIFERVHFRFTDRSPYGGTYGCFESHWKAIQDAYEDGVQHLLIFEDDVQFKAGYEEIIHDCYNFIKNEVVKDWEFLCLNGILFYGVESSSPQTPRIIMGKSIFAHAVCISRLGMARFLQEYSQPTGSCHVDHAYSQCFHRHYVHIKYDTIVQLMDTLSSDNPWEEIHRVKEADTAMLKYLQTIYMPHYLYLVTIMNVLLYYLIPYHYRPWLIANTMCQIPRQDIRIHRNGENQTFPWHDYSIGVFILNLIGGLTFLRLFYYGQIPRGMNLYHMIRILFKAKDTKNDSKPFENVKKVQ